MLTSGDWGQDRKLTLSTLIQLFTGQRCGLVKGFVYFPAKPSHQPSTFLNYKISHIMNFIYVYHGLDHIRPNSLTWPFPTSFHFFFK